MQYHECSAASYAAIGLAILCAATTAEAQDGPTLDVSGDVRLRVEQDWDSETGTGAMRDDRARSRIRLRLGAKASLGRGVTVEGRLRSAIPGSQQNANVTFADFNGNSDDTLKTLADRYAVSWQGDGAGVTAGRMGFPFYTQNEYFWDGDITPLGAAAHFALPLPAAGKLTLTGGAFLLPAGLDGYSGSLAAGQARYQAGGTTLAAGYFRFDADRSDPERLLLLDGNGERDYGIVVFDARHELSAGGKPLALGADLFHNLKGYSGSSDPFTLAHRKERTGYVLQAAWGGTARPGDWQVGYRYSRVEQLAVNASYAHDDIARFGTAAQARLSDLVGHDLYANYAVARGLTAGVRAMVARRISNGEDGKRVRLDLVYGF